MILGKKDNKILGVNAKLTFQGGERYTPIDYIESGSTHQIEEDETKLIPYGCLRRLFRI